MSGKRHYRKLSELSLIDNFLFGLFIQEATEDEIIGLLERMLDMKITGIRIKEKQHSVFNSETDKHSVCLDAFITDDEGNLYNIEMQAYYMSGIPKRFRFHQALIDKEQIPSGTFDYKVLPKTIIIFVTNFDPFKKGLYRYTFRTACAEDSEVDFNDETLKVVLNTKGTRREGVSDELVELLHYFMKSDAETAESSSSEYVKNLDRKLKPIKDNPGFGGEYMSYQEEMYIREEIGAIKGEISAYFNVGKTVEEVINYIVRDFNITRSSAEEYVNLYRPIAN